MDVYLFGALYLAVGLLVGLNAYVRGMKSRPVPSIFSIEDRAMVVLASAVVGLVWIVFTPVLLVRWIWLACRWIEHAWGQLLLRLPKVARRWT
jgi:hypothetical protein